MSKFSTGFVTATLILMMTGCTALTDFDMPEDGGIDTATDTSTDTVTEMDTIEDTSPDTIEDTLTEDTAGDTPMDTPTEDVEDEDVPGDIPSEDVAGDDGVYCGNNATDGDDFCDGTDTNGETCISQGFESGTLGCAGDCSAYDFTPCVNGCGNGIWEVGESEECDGTDLGDTSTNECTENGFTAGTMGCTDMCEYDFTSCTGGCGNDVIETGESCDGTDLGGSGFELCTDHASYLGGTLGCLGDCTDWDFTSCHMCGNDTIDTGETCDGTDLGGTSVDECTDHGFGGGSLDCLGDCSAYDFSGCSGCGNGSVDTGETCDDFNTDTCGTCSADCSTAQTGGDCVVGTGCAGDTDCASDSCVSNFCAAVCGNGVVETGESCDDFNDLACGSCDATCNGSGTGTCAVDDGCGADGDCTSGSCVSNVCVAVCGNGITETGETCDDFNTLACGTCSADCGTSQMGGDCVVDDACSGDGDCASGSCVSNVCVAVCGNGITETGETCDDFNALACGSCDATCNGSGTGTCDVDTGCGGDGDCTSGSCVSNVCVAVCGNGITETGETCDDFNTLACGTCSADCLTAQPGGDCVLDDGCEGDGDCLSGLCLLDVCAPDCGNGMTETGETCDDFNTDACGTCSATCDATQPGGDCVLGIGCSAPGDCLSGGCTGDVCVAVCGNGITETGETCDDFNIDACGSCSTDCLTAQPGGDCALGIGCVAPGDCLSGGCTGDVCVAVCGNGITETGETCDDFNIDACGSCSADCGTDQGTPNDCATGIGCIIDDDCTATCVSDLCT